MVWFFLLTIPSVMFLTTNYGKEKQKIILQEAVEAVPEK